MRRYFDTGLMAMLGLLVALIVGNGVMTHHHIGALYDARAKVDDSRVVLAALDDLLGAMQEAQGGVRAYLVTGERPYLEQYAAALPRVEPRLVDLRRLVDETSEQRELIAPLRASITSAVARLDELVALRQEGGLELARATMAEGGERSAMDDVRRLVNRMRLQETLQLNRRALAAEQSRDLALASVAFATMLAVMLVAVVLYQMLRGLQGRDAAARQLEGQKELFRTTLASLGEAVVTCDMAGHVTYLNHAAEALTGWTAGRAMGQPIADIVRVVDAAGHQPLENAADAALRDGVELPSRHRGLIVPRGGGLERPIEESAAPILDAQGRPTGAVLVLRDITERLRTETAMREADRRKDEFLAVLAHELRNPLAPLRNALHILRLASHGPQAVQQVCGVMERQVLQMVRLIDDLLDVSRITRNKLELRREPIELREVIDAAVEMSAPTVARFHHRMVLEIDEDLPPIDGDRARLVQVLDNLVTNAAKYSEMGGTITVRARAEGEEVQLLVRDTGLGIPPDMLERIFEMFTQVDRTLERSRGGLGIGLTLVRRIVELHGGRIVARSQGLGHGSEFEIALPALREALPPPVVASGIEPGSTQMRRLVVCDDNEDAAESLARMLRMMGHEVALAFDGEQCLQVCERVRPQVVLLDIGMPRMNGYDAARALRLRPGGEAMVLIALTGWGQEEDRRRAFEAGFDHHLTKPADFTVLARLLDDARRAPKETVHA